MTLRHNDKRLNGVWSAAPTPFDDKMRLDLASVRRMVRHHVRLGVDGLFLAGSNGEGPFMTDPDRRRLVEIAAHCAKGKLVIAVQVTDNSASRILANIDAARAAGRALIDLLLAPDRTGLPHALARRMGVEEIIWDCSYWGAGMDDFKPYSPCFNENGERRKHVDPTVGHLNHLHIGMSKAGAAKRTSFWTANAG